jgi:hypothetical protein
VKTAEGTPGTRESCLCPYPEQKNKVGGACLPPDKFKPILDSKAAPCFILIASTLKQLKSSQTSITVGKSIFC